MSMPDWRRRSSDSTTVVSSCIRTTRVDDRVVRMQDETTVVESELRRRQSGIDMNYDGFDLEHIEFEGDAVYRNDWRGGRLADDEIAAASLLEGMKLWVRGEGPELYPL